MPKDKRKFSKYTLEDVKSRDSWYDDGNPQRLYDKNGVWRDLLDFDEHLSIFDDFKVRLTDGFTAQENPKVIFLAGQPGAGKGGAAANAEKELGKCLVIDIDELRANHPRYVQHVNHNAENGATSVQDDASQWGKFLTAYAQEHKFNMIMDGTLSDFDSAVEKMNAFKKQSYDIEVIAVGTAKKVSQEGVRSRFERAAKAKRDLLAQARKARESGDTVEAEKYEAEASSIIPRNVEDHIHEEAFDGLHETISQLEAMDPPIVSRMRVYDRDGTLFADSQTSKKKIGLALQAKRIEALNEQKTELYNKTCLETLVAMEERLLDEKDRLEALEPGSPEHDVQVKRIADLESACQEQAVVQEHTTIEWMNALADKIKSGQAEAR